MIEVELTYWELQAAAQTGCNRHIESLCAKHKNNPNIKDEDGFKKHIQGAMGELAVAKALGRYWHFPVNEFRKPDIHPNIEVRWRSTPDKEVVVKEKDADDKIVVLVTGDAPVLKVHSYVVAKDGKEVGKRMYGGPKDIYYYVPHSAMRPIEELIQQ